MFDNQIRLNSSCVIARGFSPVAIQQTYATLLFAVSGLLQGFALRNDG